MMNVLVVDPDEKFANHLATLLGASEHEVMIAPTMGQACLNLVQRVYEVALVPVTEDTGLVRALRTLQENLRLILMVPMPGYEVPDIYVPYVQGVVAKSAVDEELMPVLAHIMETPFQPTNPIEAPTFNENMPDIWSLDIDVVGVTAVMSQALIYDTIHTAILTLGREKIANIGKLVNGEVKHISAQVANSWQAEPEFETTLIQTIQLPEHSDPIWLFTTSLADKYLLTLAASTPISINQFRNQSLTLSDQIDRFLNGNLVLDSAPSGGHNGDPSSLPVAAMEMEDHSYAIAWAPIAPLPEGMRGKLEKTLHELAINNDAAITYLEINPGLIHMVVTFPAEYDVQWALALFKNGSEKRIQGQFGLPVTIWNDVHYAIPGQEPMSGDDLAIFLGIPL